MTAQHRLHLAAFVLAAALCGTFVLNGWAPVPSPVGTVAADSPSSTAPSVLPATHLLRAGPSSAPQTGPAVVQSPSDSASAEGDQGKKAKRKKKSQDPDSVFVRPDPGPDESESPSPSPTESPSPETGDGAEDSQSASAQTEEQLSP